MRRVLTVGLPVLLAVAVATPVQAGYMIVRVILTGGATTGGGTILPGGSGTFEDEDRVSSGPIGPGGPPMGSGLGPPGGIPRLPGGPGGYQPPPIGGPGVGTTTPSTAPPADPTRSLVVVVPFDEDITKPYPFYKPAPPQVPNPNPNTNPLYRPQLRLTFRGQKIVANLFTDNSTIQLYENLRDTPALQRTFAQQVRAEYDKWSKARSDLRPLYEIVKSALEHGLVEDAVRYADEFLAAARDKKDLPTDLANFARAYGAMQKGIKGSATKAGNAELWKARLEAQDVYLRGHYALIYWDAAPDEVQRRADLLEENFKAFFLLHAVRGIELPVPEVPLTVVLPKQGRDVLRLARALDGPTRLAADGFYTPEHDVLVLAPERLDSLGLTFSRQVQQIYVGGISRDKLLAGSGPKIHAEGRRDPNKPDEVVRTPDEVARMQTLALVERFLDEASAVNAVSREGSRQLLYATGLFPRYVLLPEWLAHGAANAFARPKDPPFWTDAKGKWFMTVAATTGYGIPNYVLHRQFRDLLDKQELNPDHGALLRNVLTDAYFRGLRDPKDVIDPDPEKEDKSGVALTGGRPPTGGVPSFPGPGGVGGYQPPGGGTSLGPPPAPGGLGQPGLPPPPGGIGLGPPMPPGGLPGLTPGQPAADPAANDPAVQLRKKRERLAVKAQATAWALYFYLTRERPAEFRRFMYEIAAMPRDFPLEGDVIVARFCAAFGLDGSDESLKKFGTAWVAWLRTVPQVGIDVPLVDPKPPMNIGTGTTPGMPLGPPGAPYGPPGFGPMGDR